MYNKVKITEKKKTGVFWAIAAALMLSACGGTAPTSGNATQPDNTQVTNEQDSVQQDQTNTDSNADAQVEDTAADNTASGQGYVFEYDDLVIAVDADVAPVIEALGEPKGYFEAASCAFEGIDKNYTYNDFEISTYPAPEGDLISSIFFKSDLVSTPEGISIGSAASKVTEVYGEGTEQSGMIVYEKDGMKLCFIIKDNKVASVQYQSTAID